MNINVYKFSQTYLSSDGYAYLCEPIQVLVLYSTMKC